MSETYNKSMRTQYLYSRRLIVCLCIAALGPYIIQPMGIRLEHFVIYSSFLYIVMFKMWLFNNINIRNVYFILKFLVKQKMICFNKVKNKLSDKIYTKYSLINNYYLKKLFKYFNVDFINMFKLKS